MSSYHKADHRLVQPKAKHYKTKDGIKYLVGIYTLDQRQRYIDVQKDLLKTRYPKRSARDIKEAAFWKWREMVFATLDEPVWLKLRRQLKNKVKEQVKNVKKRLQQQDTSGLKPSRGYIKNANRDSKKEKV